MASKYPECQICENVLNKTDETVTTACQHTFHRHCAQERLIKLQKSDCRVCKKEPALADALKRSELQKKEKTSENVISKSTTTMARTISQGGKKWKCEQCLIENDLSASRCQSCGSLSSRLYNIDDYSSYEPKPRRKLSSSSRSRSRSKSPLAQPVILYIKDLASINNDDLELANKIRHRMNNTFKIQIVDIRCYSKFDIGSITVSNEKIKQHLINDIGNMSIDSQVNSPTIQFVDTPVLVSYVVLNIKNEKDLENLPNSDEVISRWKEIFQGNKPYSCEQVNIQFPNIFRIITLFDKSLVTVKHKEFAIKDRLARIYFGADCSYFEDLPNLITEEQLREEIGKTIGLEHIPSSALHIEFNKQAKNACIIACNIAHKWTRKSFIYIDHKSILKKENLPCRLIIKQVPENYDIDNILKHRIFNKQARKIKRSGTNLILEIMNKDIFDECLRIGTLTINKQPFFLKNYVAYSDPEEREIDRDTWYESEMLRNKPDIMPFIRRSDHEIFYFKWNAKLWLEQYESCTTPDAQANRFVSTGNSIGTSYDVKRHHLRVTVMLNTIAAIKNSKYIIDNQEIKLNLRDLQTIIYNHQSKLKSGGPLSSIRLPYEKTKVKVFKEDCLIVYERLINEGKKPLLLNMANRTSPGGGYRKGDGAQEENIFRRSDYYRSLDVGLDEIQTEPCKRVHCTSEGELDPSFDSQRMYPMDEYGAIYTSGLTVFRQSEDTGYEYMRKPVYNVCALAIAAYREPHLINENILDPKKAVGMRKKIENIFSIGYHHKHDCLVLSAFGCGAFKNPADHVAKLFRSVIEQYAGFFESIVFAIIDDHNAGNKINPNGNFIPFEKELNELVVKPMLLKPIQSNTKFGPYRVSSNGSSVEDIHIYDLPPCHFAAKCQGMYDPEHAQQFSHPPLCGQSLNQTCEQNNDIVHMFSLTHRIPCRHGAKCSGIDNSIHAQEFEHPSYCPSGGSCTDTSDDHERSYRHLEMCEKSLRCPQFRARIPDHCNKKRHCKPRCKYGYYCVDFHNKKHIQNYTHPFITPCPYTPYHCDIYNRYINEKDNPVFSDEDYLHTVDFAHVCQFGRNCKNKQPHHLENSIHVPHILCSYGSKCKKTTQEDHLNSFTHPNIRDIRFLCKHGDLCRDREDFKHFKRYRHGMVFGDSAVVHYCNLNNKINFVENQNNSISKIYSYAHKANWDMVELGSIPNNILNWIRIIQPVHRCCPDIFASILLHGHVMSRGYMENLKNPEFVAHSVLQHKDIRRIISRSPTLFDNVKRFVILLIIQRYNENNIFMSNSTQHILTRSIFGDDGRKSLSDKIRTEKVFLKCNLPNDLAIIHNRTLEIADASLKLFQIPTGIGYPVDQNLGTNQQVFSVLGPHRGHYYGDIVIVFKRDILHHPDANFSTQAATSFVSGKILNQHPWLKNDTNIGANPVDLFHKSKLHASIPDYEYATALELIATTSHYFHNENLGMKISLDKILERWRLVDSHFVIEAHLPQLIPLDYIEHIYIPESIYTSLTENARKTVERLFPKSITKVNKINDEYNNFILNELIQKFHQKAQDSISKPVCGTVMTIKSTNFNDHYVLPLTISQAYTQYEKKHPKVPDNCTIYIYWQIMNGDMMLTLSKRQIDPTKEQTNLKGLICYIAPKPNINDPTYHEQFSYLHTGHPFRHRKYLERHEWAAKSTAFYLGCNTDDLLTFCLEINRSNGIVILSHVGSNSIYNHEKISHKFSKDDLDLTKLEFIHVSAGVQTLPIRNLIVCFEKQDNLHVTFDEKYHQTNTSLNTNKTNDNNNDTSLLSTTYKKSSNVLSQITTFVGDTAKQVKDYVFGVDNSKLKPCRDGIYCLIQFSENGSDHNSNCSHPCRFAELCRSPEENLTHYPHQVPDCPFDKDKKCEKLTDPVHRSKFRHAGRPYFLVPCRNQRKCTIKSTTHLINYSHGEQVFEPKATEQSQAGSANQQQKTDQKAPKTDKNIGQKEPCRHDRNCADINKSDRCKWHPNCTDQSSDHQAKFWHPILCKWDLNCTDQSVTHRTTFWHPYDG